MKASTETKSKRSNAHKVTKVDFPGAVIHPESRRIVATQRDIAAHLEVADATIRHLVLNNNIRRYEPRWIDVQDLMSVYNSKQANRESQTTPLPAR